MRITLYPGQYYDQETGLHYNWNRYYDPEIGRYVSRDPSASDLLNAYGYGRNNPVKVIDFNGHQAIDAVISAASSINVDPAWLPDELKGHPLFNEPPYSVNEDMFVDKHLYTKLWRGHKPEKREDYKRSIPPCEFHLLQGHGSWNPHYISYKEPCSGTCIYGCHTAGSPTVIRWEDGWPLKQYEPKQIDNQGLDPDKDQWDPSKYRDIQDVYTDHSSAMWKYCLPPNVHPGNASTEAKWNTKFTILSAIKHFKEICQLPAEEGGCCECGEIKFISDVFLGPDDGSDEYKRLENIFTDPLSGPGRWFPSIEDLDFSIPCNTTSDYSH